ncbi:MAG: carotenoid 1,2-hydratase [Hyphomicrobiaceae bacterium]|nr:carotenoid 1,2-hydratase [Hyphomicrobiaceae bacterium]
MSTDGTHGLTIIAFVGSVFSPYYAMRRRRGAASPENHVAINVALYGRGGKRWAMTERGAGALARDTASFVVGPSSLAWDGNGLTIDIDEVTVPWPSRIRGRVRVVPDAIVADTFDIDGIGRHRWRPIAPRCHVEVALTQPSLQWIGTGYHDHNTGLEPIDTAFRRWDWSRAATGDGSVIVYDVTCRQPDISGPLLGLAIARDGAVRRLDLPLRVPLPKSRIWRIARATRCDDGETPTVVETLEDTPFYARSIVSTEIAGTRISAFHESLDLNRFRSPVVQAMLPFRMPRRG